MTALAVSVLGTVGVSEGEAEATATTSFRALDTRSGAKPGNRATRCFRVAGTRGVPSSAAAVVVNIVSVGAAGSGYATAYPNGASRPTTSALNYSPAAGTIANNAIVKVGSSGRICVYVRTSTHLVVDVSGYYSSYTFGALTPARSRDTRSGAKPGHGSTTCFKVAERNGVPASAAAVAINLTAVAPSRGGYMTVFPRDAPRPGTSNLNFSTNEVIGNGTVVGIGNYGQICVYSSASSHFIVDVTGYFRPHRGFEAMVSPQRKYDSRSSSKPGARSTRCFAVTRGNVPMETDGVFVNVTAVGPSANGYITAWADGTSRPGTSNLNYRTGRTRANGGLVTVGTEGRICVYTSASAHYVVDVLGYEPAAVGSGSSRALMLPPAQADVGRVYHSASSGRSGQCQPGYFREVGTWNVDWKDFIVRQEVQLIEKPSKWITKLFTEVTAYHQVYQREVCMNSRYTYQWVALAGSLQEICAYNISAFRLVPTPGSATLMGRWQRASLSSRACLN